MKEIKGVSPNGELLVATVRRFATQKIAPVAAEIDETGRFPRETTREMAELGIFGIMIPEAYGGSYISHWAYYMIIKEIAKKCASHAMILLSHSLCSRTVFLFGTETQKKEYLPPLARGEWLGAVALTEAEAGSDLGGIRTRVERASDVFVMNGSKQFITNGGEADVIVVLASETHRKPPFHTSLFIVESGMDGFSVGRRENKMGFRASDTRELSLNNLHIPSENLLGSEGKGIFEMTEAMESSKTAFAAIALGIAESAFEASVKYAKQRRQFGQSLSRFQGIQFEIAEMATRLECGRMMIYGTAQQQDDGKRCPAEAAMTKYYCAEMVMQVSSTALQIFGGYGYTKDFPLERHMRDARLFSIAEGTNEMQKLIIAANALERIT